MIKDLLFELSCKDAVGSLTEAADFAFCELSKYTETQKLSGLSCVGYLKGENTDYTLMLDAHIDQIAMVVTDIDDKGFLTVSKAGGIDLRALPSRRVVIYGKERVEGVFCSIPPHLAKGEMEFDDISKLKIDTLLGSKAKEVISLGDFVTFSGEPICLANGKVSGKSFDDRAGVACLIEVARKLQNEKLPFNVAFVLSDSEELGLRGSKTATFKVNPNEAIAVDVSFGDGIGISDEECGKLGAGGMVGIAPSLDKALSNKLIATAKENNIPYQLEVMGGKTGTNADVIGINREGVKTGTLSIPLRNMHTDCEILDLKDLEAVVELLCRYILAGGVFGA